MRDLTAAVTTELSQSTVIPILLAELDFSSGFARFWTGHGNLTWDSKTWSGTGLLGEISPLSESTELRAAGYSLRLSGLPSELIAIALGEHYQNRNVKIWLGFFDSSGALIADPALLLSARMDTMAIAEAGDTCSISLNIESAIFNLRERTSRYTNQEQQRRFPGDTGLSRVAALVDKTIFWGPGGAKGYDIFGY